VQREGKAIRTKHLSVRSCASSLSHPRVGLIVPRFGRTAVERNRMKRRLREAVRLELLPHTLAADVVVRASQSAYELSYAGLRREVVALRALLGSE